MRTEVKIGIVVALMVVGAVIFFVVQQGHRAGSDVTDVLPMDAPARRLTGTPVTPKPARPAPAGGRRTPGTESARHAAGPTTPDRTSSTLGGPAETPATPDGEPRVTAVKPATLTPGRPAGAAREPTSRPGLDAGRPTIGAATAQRRPPVIGADTRSDTAGREAPAGTRVDSGAQRTPVVTPPPRPTIGAEQPRTTVRTPAVTPSSRPRKHVIAENDNLWSLAMQYYDDGSLWPKIKAANPGLDETKLKIGQEIIIPPRDEVVTQVTRSAERSEPTPRQRPAARAYTYVIEQDDTLIGIARNILGDGSRWREIWDLNKEAIPNPDVLPIGTELKLPPRDSSGPQHG